MRTRLLSVEPEPPWGVISLAGAAPTLDASVAMTAMAIEDFIVFFFVLFDNDRSNTVEMLVV